MVVSDVFISHASEDKDAIARPLAEQLRERGFSVWYDEYVLKLGDSLPAEIDRGLASCRFGVVILSPRFFAKGWPKRELDGLAAREVRAGQKVILPVWHEVSAADVEQHSPTLAAKLAVSTAKGLERVVREIVAVLGEPPTTLHSPRVEFPDAEVSAASAGLTDEPIRKQQRIEDELAQLRAGVRAIESPLLPCGIFSTLRIEAPDEGVQRVFGEQSGYRAYGPDRPMPAPPVGLPPGLRDGRLFSQDGYLDYRGGVLEAAGVFYLDHPGYNPIQCTVGHTVCRFDPKARSRPLSPNEPLFSRPSVKLYPGGRPNSPANEPALVLQSSALAGTVVRANALDNTVFIDLVFQSLTVHPPDASGWSTASLKGAFLRFTFDFFYIEGLSSLPKESWPRLHNLQLWLSGTGRYLLAFSPDHLAGQSTAENPTPLARGQAVCPQIVFEYELSPEAFSTILVSAA